VRNSTTIEPLEMSSLFTALLGFITPFSLVWGFGVAAVWVLMVIAAFIRFRREGLWLLVGAPFVFFWPIALVRIVEACKSNINACP
jgi:hypothetical protein